jgi:TonB family protein
MEMLRMQDSRFKRAVILSASVHILLFIFLVISPYLPKPSRKGTIHYVELMSFGGGGGGRGAGGGGGGRVAPAVKTETEVETAAPQRESLRDLTTPTRLEQTQPPAMTHPLDKPQRDPSPKPEKKAVIQKSQPNTKSSSSSQSETGTGTETGTNRGSGGSGSRVGLGFGEGTGGFGFGEGYGGGGLSTFPYSYYVQEIQSRISGNWQTALIRSGTTGNDFVEVRFRIFRDGRISEPEIGHSSDNLTMNSSAIRAVRNASPFPPLPRGYEDEYLIVRLLFEHNR